MELPETLIDFAISIGSTKCTSWSKPNRVFLEGQYDHIKTIKPEKSSSHLEWLIEKIVDMDKSTYKIEINTPISYNQFLTEPLPNKISELEKNIWFLAELKNNKEQWEAAEKTYQRLRSPTLSTHDHTEAKHELVKVLRKAESHFRREFINHLEVTQRPVLEYRIRLAKRLYPRAFRPTKADIDSLRENFHLKRIGLGVEGTYKEKPIHAYEVVIDTHTTPPKKNDKYALYIPGWSLCGAFAESD